MHVFIVEVINVDETSFIYQVMDSPRGAFESMREYAASIGAKVDEVEETRWMLIDKQTNAIVGEIESHRKPVMHFNGDSDNDSRRGAANPQYR